MAPARSNRRIEAVVGGEETLVYSDGSCLGNPGPGGWAWAVPDGPYASGAEEKTTNQRMEITAALKALEALEGDVFVKSDSTYVVNCFRDRWWEGWLKRGWRNAAGKPVANRDLWEELLEEALGERRSVRWGWVKGHSGDEMNDRVDLLAVEAATTQRGVSGEVFPKR
jgi:ribonuclease HI